jgi:CubicO group peptidase (beta-lactamase class C family)
MNPRTVAPRFALGVALLLLALSRSAAAAPPDPAAVDSLLAEALKVWNAPGLAVAIVRADEVVYLKGSGLRKLGGTEPVTPDTLFGIGSLTKAFTATALGQLVDEGKVGWDDLVRKHVPFFRLADPLADRDVTLRDLLCHRTGLARHDLLWYRAPWGVEESVRRLAHLEPSHSFRSAYEYNNLAYLVAGLAVARASGSPWHDFVQKRLFDPLGMKGAVFTSTAAQMAADHASPHRRAPDGKVEVIPWYPDDKQIRASGSIKAGARDLSRWLRLQLGGGVVDGRLVISAAALRQTHTPQVVVPPDRREAPLTDTTQVSYGLGWRIRDYRGHHLLEHGGAVDGFRARILLLPRARTGLVVLTNLEEMGVVSATGNALLDHLLGLPKKDWHAFYRAEQKRAEEARKAREEKRLAARHRGTKPSREHEAYTGAYHDPAYGTARVTREDKELALSWSSFRVPLQHFHFDTFTVAQEKGERPNRLTGEMAVFTLNGAGEVDTLRFLGRTFTRTGVQR